MELQGYIVILRARWQLVVTVTLIALLAAWTYSLSTTPTYVARSSVFLTASIGRTSGELARSFTYAQGLVRSYAQIATQPVILNPVISRLQLDTTPGRLARSITAQAPLDTVIIDIEVSDASARRAAQIANAVAAQLSATAQDLVPGSSETALPVSVTTVAPAEVPKFASSPRTTLNLSVALLIGLLLGAALAISRDALDVRVRGPRDATTLTKVPVIGSIMVQSKGSRRLIPALRRRSTGSAKQLDVLLRTNFEFMRSRRSLKSVVFTSALLDSATTATVSNLGSAIGETGVAVLIVDADMRRPTLAALHGLHNTVGLTSVLTDGAPVRSVILQSQTSPVWVLPAGPELRDPSLMLDEDAMKSLLGQLVRLFDVVLVKSPPVLRVADGLLLARLSDGVVVVADEDAMNRDVLTEEMRSLDIGGSTVLGMVLTRGS